MNKKLVFVLLIALMAIGVQTASAQSNSCVSVNGNSVCGEPATIAAILSALDNQGGGQVVVAQAEAEVNTEPTALPLSEAGCFEVEGSIITEVECEASAALAATDQGGGASFDYTPRGESFAIGMEAVGNGWYRVLEGVARGEYFSWNFFSKISCDRPVRKGEVRWDRPIHLTIEPSIEAEAREPLSCLIEIRRDLDSSANWQTAGHSMDPYDSSLGNNTVSDASLAWFVAGYAEVGMDNGQQLSLATEACSEPNHCPVPTYTNQPANGLIPTPQWSAAEGGEGPRNAAVIREFPRNFEGTMWWHVTVKPGDSFKVWQGVYIPQPEIAEPETVHVGGGVECFLTANRQINVRVSPSTTADAEPLIAGASLPIQGEQGVFWQVPGGYVSQSADVTLSEGCLG